MLINGKNIVLRTVEIEDAEFIFNMRQNTSKTKYLSNIDGNIDNQINWIKSYKKREQNQQEFYFIIESKEMNKLGLVRVYDIRKNSFSWGSWLIKENAPKSTAIESVLQIYEFGFYKLGFQQSHFKVSKENDKVIAFHQRFGARIIDDNDNEHFFNFQKKDYEIIKKKYKRYL